MHPLETTPHRNKCIHQVHYFLHKMQMTGTRAIIFSPSTFQIWYWPATDNIRTAKVAEFGKVFSGVITGLEKDKLYQLRVFGTSSGGDGKKTPPTFFTLGRCRSLSFMYRVHTRFQVRSKDQEIKRREVELDLQVSPEEFMSREVELGCESWTSFASSCPSTAVQRTLSL